jgi:nucleoid-associated protein YgaU
MAGVKNGSSLVRATLSIHHPPSTLTGGLGGQIRQVRFQFNPNQLQLSRSTSWNAQHSVGFARGAAPQFSGANPASLQIEVFLDGSAEPAASKVREDVEHLLSCCEVDLQSLPTMRPSPPWVRFAWGSFSTVQFIAYVESVSATYTLFTATGDPLRANCQLTLTEVPLPTKGQNPTSGTLAAQRVHRVVSGDSLESLAWQEYGDATRWRAIAEANAIDDPMRLETGRELLLPATEEVAR